MVKVNCDSGEIDVIGDTGINDEILDKAIKSSVFNDWLNEATKEKRWKIHTVTIQSVDMFGPRVGFVKFKADISNETGLKIPGIVFGRGGAVGILVVLHCEGVDYTVLTVQPRVPVGMYSFPEIPAGMLDGNDHFSGVAAKELKEEVFIYQ